MITNTMTGTPSNHPSMYLPILDLRWFAGTSLPISQDFTRASYLDI